MYIQLDSQVLYYEKEGDGKPLVLLHGNGEDHTIFDALLPHLTPRFTVYSLDSRGCGLSSPSKEYHYADMAEDVAKLISAVDIGTPSLLGFSDGAITALLLAIRYPKLIDRLIACGANLTPKGLTFFTRREIKSLYRKTKSNLVKMMLTEPQIAESDLRSISAPTLVVAGEKDMVKASETKKIASAIPNATLKIIPKADHMDYIVHNDLLAEDVIRFLS